VLVDEKRVNVHCQMRDASLTEETRYWEVFTT
jgi:hypothetical protein